MSRQGKTLRIDWHESQDELYRLYKAEHHPQKRTRLQVLWLLRSSKTGQEAADACGVGARTVRRWVAWYRDGGLDGVLGRLNGQKGGGIPRLSEAQETELKQEINTGRFHTAQEIIEWVDEKWGVRYKPGAMYALLRRLKMRKKVPRRQADKADPEAQAAWKKGV